MASVVIKFDHAAMGEAFLGPGTGALVASQAQGIAARAGHGCRAHTFEGRGGRPMASVWTSARTPAQARAATLALEGVV